MKTSNSEQDSGHTMGRVGAELEEMRERVQRGTDEADSGQFLSASEVFSELRERNEAAAKRT